MLDATDKLVLDAEISACVLGNFQGEFVLHWLGKPLDQTAVAVAEHRNFVYCGTLGVLHGRAVVEPGTGPGVSRALLNAALEFARTVAERLKPEPEPTGDVAWLKKLYQLPDTREVL